MADTTTGPEKIVPADSLTTTSIAGHVKLRMAESGVGAKIPLSIPGLLKQTSSLYPSHPAMVYKNHQKVSTTITFEEYRNRVLKIAKAFIKLGLQPRHTVAVMAFNSPEWFISELAAIHAGGIITGVYTTNSPEAVHHILESSNADIVIVDDAKQMEKIYSIKHKLPNLKAVIQTLPPYAPYVKRDDGYYRWSEIEEMKVDEFEDELNNRIANIAINECCCIVYTSGTVGKPKGVMLSHDNITWDAYAVGQKFNTIEMAKEVLVSYLPLSHIAAQMVDIFIALHFAATVYFADKDALKGTLINTLLEARPTRMLGVPRVFEKIQEKMIHIGSRSGLCKQMVANWAKNVTLQHHINMMEGRPSYSLQYRLAKSLILSKVKDSLGLGRMQTMVTGAAPMSAETKKYFMSLDMPIMEAFGMSECCDHCCTTPESYNFDTIGKNLEGGETKVAEPDENGHGELCFRGRHIFMGYINDEEKTKEAVDEEGWLHSGDLGYVDEKGFLYITGRIKEIIITAGGENIPPVVIENNVKSEVPALSNAFLVGDKKKFLTMLVTLKTLVDTETGKPKDELQHETVAWLRGLGLAYTKLSEILDAGPCPIVFKAIEEGIVKANKSATSNAQKVQKFAILPHDFSIPTGELGPTLKVKRNVVVDMYKQVIDKFYA